MDHDALLVSAGFSRRFRVVPAALLLSLGVEAQAQNRALSFNGTNQYVTFGVAPGSARPTFTLEIWFKRTGVGAITTTGTGGITSAIPLLTKGRGEAEGSNVDMNYFLGIRSTDSVLVADYEEGTGQASPGLNHPIAGVTPVRSQVWYHAAVTFDGTTLRLYLNGKLESTRGGGCRAAAAVAEHPALRDRHRDDLDRRGGGLLRRHHGRGTRVERGAHPGRHSEHDRPRRADRGTG